MPERIRLSRTKGWRKPEGAVVVSRGTRWGNPARVVGSSVVGLPWGAMRAQFGRPIRSLDALGPEVFYASCSSVALATEEAVDIFRAWCKVAARDYPERFEQWIAPLRGHDLGCWCSLDATCHADVLLLLANPTTENERVLVARA